MHIQEQKVIGIGAEVFGPIAQERLCWLQVSGTVELYIKKNSSVNSVESFSQ